MSYGVDCSFFKRRNIHDQQENHIQSSHITTLLEKNKSKAKAFTFLKDVKFRCQGLVNFYRGAIKSNQPGNIANWHGSRTKTGQEVSAAG